MHSGIIFHIKFLTGNLLETVKIMLIISLHKTTVISKVLIINNINLCRIQFQLNSNEEKKEVNLPMKVIIIFLILVTINIFNKMRD